MISVKDSLQHLHVALSTGAIAALCEKYSVDVLVLFGSAVDSEDPGDVDIAVAFEYGHKSNLLLFIDALSDLVPGDNLDIMSLADAGPVALARALTAPKVLYARTHRSFYDRQTFAINHYIDTQHLRDAQLRILARGASADQ